jgi:hypothetical protein
MARLAFWPSKKLALKAKGFFIKLGTYLYIGER